VDGVDGGADALIILPSAMANIAHAAFIAPNATILGNVTIGADASIWYGAVLRGDTEAVEIGAETNIQDLTTVHADPGAPCRIGRRVGVGHRAVLHGCVVEDLCLIGMGSILLNHAHIGTGSVVAAGAVVPEGMTVPPGSVVMGVPARIVRSVDPILAERIAATWSRYVALARRHQAGEFRRTVS
jgi:carbonic anhydrase/acetyltransferase-like protein (isoleucine patch superfamily)